MIIKGFEYISRNMNHCAEPSVANERVTKDNVCSPLAYTSVYRRCCQSVPKEVFGLLAIITVVLHHLAVAPASVDLWIVASSSHMLVYI